MSKKDEFTRHTTNPQDLRNIDPDNPATFEHLEKTDEVKKPPRDPEYHEEPQQKGKRGRREQRKQESLDLSPVATLKKEKKGGNQMKQGKQPTTETKTTQTQTPRPDLEACPVCGGLKEKAREVADGKTVKLLTDGACSKAYRNYCEEATKAIVADPANAPEPMGKFEWVLQQIDLSRFEKEAKEAVATYRNKYDATVTVMLQQRGYLDGEPKWGEEDHLRRPQIRFTEAAFQTGAAVKQGLEESLNEDYKHMRRLLGRLETATRVEPELREAIAKATTENTKPETTEEAKWPQKKTS